VLLDYIADLERATEFAEKVDDPEVWSLLGKAQLTPEGVVSAIAAYIKAQDTTEYAAVIATAEAADEPAALVEYLTMCRKKVKEAHVDTSLIYAYAKAGMHSELEEFISAPNVGRIQDVAERCYAENMYVPAKLMFTSISNFARLATCLVRLGELQASVDAARKANSTRTWKEVNASCVEHAEFRLAQICALHIIVNPLSCL
jgi:clathrin heavy chain